MLDQLSSSELLVPGNRLMKDQIKLSMIGQKVLDHLKSIRRPSLSEPSGTELHSGLEFPQTKLQIREGLSSASALRKLAPSQGSMPKLEVNSVRSMSLVPSAKLADDDQVLPAVPQYTFVRLEIHIFVCRI
jgi:hypothetical protein